MPRTVLEPQFAIEHLSILDSDGILDTALEPELSPDDLRRLYRAMLLGRRLDERMLRLQRQGRIGTFAPIKGQEASQLGTVFTLRKTDWMVPSFRETAAMLWRGWPIEKILLLFAGYLEGGQPAPEQHDLPITIPVATQLPHAVGLADAAQYRSEEEVKAWERKDPLTRFSTYLEKKNLLESGLEQQVDDEIARAVEAFEATPPADPLAIFDHAYAEMPPHLQAGRAEMAERLRRGAGRRAGEEAPPPSPPMRGQRRTSRWQN